MVVKLLHLTFPPPNTHMEEFIHPECGPVSAMDGGGGGEAAGVGVCAGLSCGGCDYV